MDATPTPGLSFKQTVEDLLDANFFDTEDTDDAQADNPMPGSGQVGLPSNGTNVQMPDIEPLEGFSV